MFMSISIGHLGEVGACFPKKILDFRLSLIGLVHSQVSGIIESNHFLKCILKFQLGKIHHK